MVGPSMTDADRKRFLRYTQVGFALLIGVSMGLVTLYGGAELLVVAGMFVGGTVVGGGLAWYIIPESIAETPYESVDRGPKPGAKMKQRRQENDGSGRRASEDDGRLSQNRD
ncbi:hypothetical protein ACNO8S_07445 [Haloarcula sp. KBTZ06]|uniref:Uncharacterized protein n=2 Tax=Haloarcula TaxID=2237 RepID=A0A5J5LK78_HALHI|nr:MULTISPECIES: hypothetical protein [Haloarcula]AJF27106.1 hypothetical protein SG26_15860 [Haloarcula sp. CBA1115]KAA9409868.1 hypothetical protein EGO51_08645 [Haloarcula hispanica]